MEDHEQNIDNLFRDALDNYSETPPPAVWNSLQSRLTKTPGGVPGSSVANRLKFFFLALLVTPRIASKFSKRSIIYASVILLLIATLPVVHTMYNLHTGTSIHVRSNTNDNSTTSLLAPGTISPKNADNPSPHTIENSASRLSAQDQAIPLSAGVTENVIEHSKAGIAAKQSRSKSTLQIKTKPSKYAHTTPASGKHQLLPGTSTTSEKARSESNVQPPQIMFNSKPENLSVVNEKDNAEPKSTDNGINKPITNTNTSTNLNPNMANKPKKSLKVAFDRWEAGVKIGFERGFDNDAGKKAVLSGYLQYNITAKVAVMTQPSVKYAYVDNLGIGNPKTYYKENSDSMAHQTGPSTFLFTGENYYVTPFRYEQHYDSIVKTNVFGGTYTELDIPLLLKYKISKDFSIYGGINLVYSKTLAIKEKTANYNNLLRTKDTFTITTNANPSQPYNTSSILSYYGTDIMQYKGAQYPSATTNEWRAGYMLGFSYEFYRRWLFDGLIQQAYVGPSVQGGYNVNSALSSTYFRFTLGYKLLK